jgi:endonuclease VIII-like 1
MPEHAELRIVADFINSKSKNKVFTKIWHVHKGNNPEDSNLIENFNLTAESNGKELVLTTDNGTNNIRISVFMGMTGNWKWVSTNEWSNTKFTRMRIDSTCGNSLLLFGYYMGPKYRVGGFTGVKRGPDPVKEKDLFIENIKSNLHRKDFTKSIVEVIMNQKWFNGIGAYLTAEILGRIDINPFLPFNSLSNKQIDIILEKTIDACNKAYEYGGGELLDWDNPFGESKIDDWIKYYGNKDSCVKVKVGSRNIWIKKEWISYDDN